MQASSRVAGKLVEDSQFQLHTVLAEAGIPAGLIDDTTQRLLEVITPVVVTIVTNELSISQTQLQLAV